MPRPFPRLSYADALERYGSDKPDLRFGMPITDVTEEMKTLGLETFPALIDAGARARAIVLPAAGGISGTRLRKINEELWLGRIVPDAHASKRNLFVLKATDAGDREPRARRVRTRTVARALLQQVRRRARRHRAHRRRRGRAAGDGAGHPAPGDGQAS